MLQKELCKKYKDFAKEELLKTENGSDQTGLAARYLTIARQTSCFTFEALIQWIPNKLLVFVIEPNLQKEWIKSFFLVLMVVLYSLIIAASNAIN